MSPRERTARERLDTKVRLYASWCRRCHMGDSEVVKSFAAYRRALAALLRVTREEARKA